MKRSPLLPDPLPSGGGEGTKRSADAFLTELRSAIREFTSKSVLVAVSGGPDSVALLLGLGALCQEFALTLHAAHVHHGWRGAEADGDAEFVRNLGRSLHVPTEILQITSDHQPQMADKSREEGARDVRYQLLLQAATRTHCDVIAVGHTADDQVETVLHHIVRGTGLAGLAGMPSERRLTDAIRLIRPLLGVTRADVLQYLADRQQSYRVDATNADVNLTRNRLRHALLPLLREKFNPRVDAALLRLARQAGEATQLLDELAQHTLDQVLLQATEAECRLDASRLADESDVLIRQMLRRLWIQQRWPRQEMGQREWERLAELVQHPGAIDLPGGVTARRDAGPLILSRRDLV